MTSLVARSMVESPPDALSLAVVYVYDALLGNDLRDFTARDMDKIARLPT
jgi:hypothetical protein